MVGKSHLVHAPSVHPERVHSPRDQYSCFQNAARRGDGSPRSVLKPNFFRQLGRDFSEQLRLQLCQVRKCASHSSRCVMFSEAISREHVRKARIPRRVCIRIIRTLFLLCRWIWPLRVQRISQQRLQRLVMRRQRPILQSAGNVQPADAVRMKNEWSRAAKCLHPVTVLQIFPGVWRSGLLEIGSVEPSPLSFLLIPPDQLLTFAPRLSVRTRRRPVVNYAAIIGPRESPTVS